MKRLILLVLLLTLPLYGQEVRRPTADSDNSGNCYAGSTQVSSSGAAAYDNNSGTALSLSVSGNTSVNRRKGRTFLTWAAASGPYISLNIKTDTNCTDDVDSPDVAAGACDIGYSTDSGSTWTDIRSDDGVGGWARVTDTTSIPAITNLNTVQVRACVHGSVGSVGLSKVGGTGVINLYEIWTEGVLGSGRRGQVMVVQSIRPGAIPRYEWRRRKGDKTMVVAWTRSRRKAMRWISNINS